LSLYGYPRETTPNLNRIAERATVFNRHYSTANFTTPGTASLLTGLYPWSHRAINLTGYIDRHLIAHNLFNLAKGYHTEAFTHNPLALILLNQFRKNIDILPRIKSLASSGKFFSEDLFLSDFHVAYWSEVISRGILYQPFSSSLFLSIVDRLSSQKAVDLQNQYYRDNYPLGIPDNLMDISFVLEDTIDWIIEQTETLQNTFLSYYHLWPPHSPYRPSVEFLDLFHDGKWMPRKKPDHHFSEGQTREYLIEQSVLYDEYICNADAEFGRLYDTLYENGLLENTYLIVTADHGELFERGILRHLTPVLYEPLIRVPLIIFSPGQNTRKDVWVPTSSVDLVPTLLHIMGQQIPASCEGQILPGFDDNSLNYSDRSDRSIFALEAKSNPKQAAINNGTLALVKGNHKLIHYFGYEGFEDEYEFYDLKNDPEEMNDLYPSRTKLVAKFKHELNQKLAEVNQTYKP
jgi:arylsulfatase A-like enzyme